jgi:hypothetical protein
MSNGVNLSLQKHYQRETDDLNVQRDKDQAEVEKVGKLVAAYKEMVGKLGSDEKEALDVL